MRIGLLIAAALAVAGAGPQSDAPPPVLELPLACLAGGGCLIQQYVDHDPGPGARDYRCGARSYDGHDGTDFRLPSMAEERRGVPVLAAAAGSVRGVRDGVTDISVRDGGKAAIAGRECGNGVVLTHPGGWETQYCHMRQGSIAVHPGDRVASGQALGLVGLSGDTEFPHVHLSVRHDGRKIDPFAYDADPASCGGGHGMWSPAAARTLAYRPSAMINQGFAAAPPTMADVEAGDRVARPTRDAPALIFYVRLAGVRAGDVLTLSLAGADGSILARTAAPIAADKAQWLAFAGKRHALGAWPAGRYLGEYRLTHDGTSIAEGQAILAL